METMDEELYSLISAQKAKFFWRSENAIYSCWHRLVNMIKAMTWH